MIEIRDLNLQQPAAVKGGDGLGIIVVCRTSLEGLESRLDPRTLSATSVELAGVDPLPFP